MMFRTIVMVLALGAGPAAATCADRIAFLDEALEEAARLSIATSTGGQGVAGAREAQAVTEETADPAPYQDPPAEADAVRDADAAGDGGERILQARAALAEAQAKADDGDEDACQAQAHDVLMTLIAP